MNLFENDNLPELISDVQNDVEGAFEKLYKVTVKFSYGIASLLLTNKEDIEDVLQNSYMYVAKSIKSLKNPNSFESWLSTIVKHECQKYIAKHKRATDIFSAVLRAKEFEFPVEESLPFDLLERREVSESVHEIINGLSADKRACVVLYYFCQNSLPEIAEILGVPEGTVKSRLFSARKTIEKEFKKMQRSDDTLFGISAIPLVAAFLAYQVQHVSIPAAVAEGTAVCAAATAVGSVATSATTAATATSAAAGTTAAAGSTTAAGATAGVAVTTKVAAVAVAAAVATGGGAATVSYINNQKEAATTLPPTSITEEYTTAAAIFTEAVLAVTEPSTEQPTAKTTTRKSVTEAPTTASTTAVITEKPTTTSVHTAKRETTTRKRTTRQSTTAAVSTTVAETTQKETTTEAATVEETTEATTRKKSTTAVPTTDAADIYSVSGGVLSEYTGEGGSVSVPSSVGVDSITAVGTGAFAGNEEITSVSLPSTVTKIGQEAFADCTNLRSVSLPSSLKSIGIGAFCGCESLTSVSIPSGVTTIGDDAFADCSDLTSVTIPSGVTSIGDNVFGGCDNLTIKCPEGSAAHDYAVENSINYELI